MIKDEKGLATAELLFITLVALVIIAGSLSIINNEINISNSGDWGQVRVLGEKLAESVNTVYTNGNGYAINFTIPASSSSFPALSANMTNSSGTGNIIMYLGSPGSPKNITIRLIPKSIQSSIILTNNHNYLIKNNNGTIIVTQIS